MLSSDRAREKPNGLGKPLMPDRWDVTSSEAGVWEVDDLSSGLREGGTRYPKIWWRTPSERHLATWGANAIYQSGAYGAW